MQTGEYAIQAVGVTKSFGGVKALSGINLAVRANTIHCIVGENGAGKSTLMKIFSGVLDRDGGDILVSGRPVDIRSPKDSSAHGIGIIYQEFVLAPDMTVAENIFLDNLGNGGFFVNGRALRAKAREITSRFGFDIDPGAKVEHLSVAYMQIVEIAKALAKDVKVLILDEPTAVLSEPEIRVLFDILAKLKASGVTIIYISHRLEEVFEIGDDITVIKDGETMVSAPRTEFDRHSIIRHMTGRDMSDLFPRRTGVEIGEEIFRADNVSQADIIDGISLSVRKGEVVGIAGLVGSGRTEFARTVFGMDRLTSGELFLCGESVRMRTPREAVKRGIGLVPENRKDQGLILPMSIAENLTSANLRGIASARLFINRKRENGITRDYGEKLRIKRNSDREAVGNLSGGNQQKVVLAKWLNSGCRFLILDEPTRGVDVGAKYEIYTVINELATAGYGILIISSEVIEIIGMCDRVYVFAEGRVAGELAGDALTEEAIMHMAIPTRHRVEA